MRRSAILVICGLNALLVACFFLVSSSSAQTEQLPKGKWVQNDKVPFWIAYNDVVRSAAGNRRNIYMFVDATNFNEQNITKLFTSLADEFKVPDKLEMLAYSDRIELQKAISLANGGCTIFGNRRRARNYYIWTSPRSSGYMRAEYSRRENGREAQIRFSPNASQEHLKIIYHVNPPFEYPEANFINAAAQGDLDGLKLRISQDKSGELLRTAGTKALSAAAANGQAQIVNTLLEARAPGKGDAVNSALLAAASDGNDEIIKILLVKGADVNACTGTNHSELNDSALMLAALHGHLDVAKLLLANGAKVNDKNLFGETPFMQAAVAGFPAMLRLLARAGADVSARDVDGKTALMLARDDRETVETLLKFGADYRTLDNYGETALMLAIESSEATKQEALIANGAGNESIDAAKRYNPLLLQPRYAAMPIEYLREEGYLRAIDLYLKLGLKIEAVGLSKEMIDTLGDNAIGRAQLGLTYIATGDRNSAMEQYNILKSRIGQAQDKTTKTAYEVWTSILWDKLHK